MHGDKIKSFLTTGVAVFTPRSQYTWRTLPALARGIGGTIENVLEGLKEDPEGFEIRLGRHGDVYVKVA